MNRNTVRHSHKYLNISEQQHNPKLSKRIAHAREFYFKTRMFGPVSLTQIKSLRTRQGLKPLPTKIADREASKQCPPNYSIIKGVVCAQTTHLALR